MDAITAEGVSKRFGDVQALDDVSLSIPEGRIYALLGPNGAGKTTLIKIMTTLLRPDAGHVEVGGLDVVSRAAEVREIIGLAGQFAAVDDHLTGRENLEMVARLYHLSRRQAQHQVQQIIDRLDLTQAADRTGRTYSGGMRRRLDLGASFITAPRILFLDEPTTGLDPHGRAELWSVIRELTGGGTTLLLTTQNLEEAEELADRIAIIDRGKLIADGTAGELKDRVGGSVLEFRIAATDGRLQRAADVTADLFVKSPTVEAGINRICGSVESSTNALTEVVRRLDREQIPIADIRLRKPSLNEVFLTLTGNVAEER
ncbi:MAG: ATP-binding cassette domain-containing protein [Actinomycetota bacterium]|nr:ATP-binding cassette domain-containing protein [Actinomycetota bacterium]MCL6092399.1 ATP-binding cassette domain-containing protein [Actinomycetota bacterium]MDA8166346.1 ATP-binding cassette domain-containing protein [Actinomycetota bacterium]